MHGSCACCGGNVARLIEKETWLKPPGVIWLVITGEGYIWQLPYACSLRCLVSFQTGWSAICGPPLCLKTILKTRGLIKGDYSKWMMTRSLPSRITVLFANTNWSAPSSCVQSVDIVWFANDLRVHFVNLNHRPAEFRWFAKMDDISIHRSVYRVWPSL